MKKSCAGCGSLGNGTLGAVVPLFLEPIVFAQRYQPDRRFFACVACGRHWSLAQGSARWQAESEVPDPVIVPTAPAVATPIGEVPLAA